MSSEQRTLDELVIPPGTTAEEHAIATDADVFIAGRSEIDFAVRGESVLAGEGVSIGGDVEADGDCRLGMWSGVDGSVLVGRDAYLGERAEIDGKLVVGRDLDIGDDVDIAEGFEANGWIVIRNPMPFVMFFIAYVSHVLRTGDEEALAALEEAAEEAATETPTLTDGAPALIVPRGATISDDRWQVSTPATIGADCRLNGNIKAAEITVEEHTTVYGSLRSDGPVDVAEEAVIHGDIEARSGSVRLAPGATVKGDVRAHDLELAPTTVVEGSMRARGEVEIINSDAES